MKVESLNTKKIFRPQTAGPMGRSATQPKIKPLGATAGFGSSVQIRPTTASPFAKENMRFLYRPKPGELRKNSPQSWGVGPEQKVS